MKKIYFILLCSFAIISCENDLELRPKDSLTPENFYSNPANFKTALMGIYNALQSSGMYNFISLSDGISDNAVVLPRVTDFFGFGTGQITSSTNSQITNHFEHPFIVIQRANGLLDNIDNEGIITDAERNSIKAEAKALRAIAYARLVYFFGDVPLIKTVLPRGEYLTQTRTQRQEVIEFIFLEMQEAASILKTTPFNGEKGRLTSQAVLGMLARYSVYEARLGNLSWQQALTNVTNAKREADLAGKKLFIAGNGQNGELNYKSLFYEVNEDNIEVLFSVKYNLLNQAEPAYERYGVLGGTLYMTILQNFVDDFYTTDGLPISNNASIFDPNNPYKNRDPRLAANIIVPGSLWSNGGKLVELTLTSNTIADTPYFVRKQVTKNGDEGIELNDNRKATLDVIILRYAELLLLLAEAENEVNGPTLNAYSAINQVRKRVNMPNVATGLSKSQFREEVIHERRVELPFEDTRWLDLITLGIANERINNIKEFGRTFLPNKQELFPIPQIEIDKIPSLLPNNPGY